MVSRVTYLREWKRRNPAKIREYNRRWSERHPERARAKGRRHYHKSGVRRLTRYQAAIWWYKLTHPCTDCGEADPVVLEFDHVPERGRKTKGISNFQPLASAIIEIQKCDVVCANCHRRRGHRRLRGGL